MRDIWVGVRKKIRYIRICISRLKDHKYIENVLIDEGKLVFHNGKDFSDRIVYLIDLRGTNTGFFAQCRYILAFLQYADQNGYVPVIRMSDFAYRQKKCGNNVYDYFFVQPSAIGISDIRRAKYVVYADAEQVRTENILLGGYGEKEGETNREVLMWRKYFRYNSQISFKLNHESTNVLAEEPELVLGIHIRGGDYKQQWRNHPVQLKVKDYYNAIDEAIKKGFKKIFLATDDEHYLGEFLGQYGDSICFYKDVIRTNNQEGVHAKKYRLENGYRLGYEALRDMYTLSLCGGLITGISHVGTVARIEKLSRGENYQFIRIIDKGIY